MQTQDIRHGEFECGCGQKTSIATRNDARIRVVKGQSRRFVPGHYLRHAPDPSVLYLPVTAEVDPGSYEFVCRGCDQRVVRQCHPGRPATVCSPECRAEASRRQARAWYAGNPEKAKEQFSRQPDIKRIANQAYYEANREREIQRALAYARGDGKQAKAARDAARYALTRGATEAELFTLDEIFARDGGVCHLCEHPVDRCDATMDHVIPVTKSGPHTRANVKLAHRGCNTRKGNRLLAA